MEFAKIFVFRFMFGVSREISCDAKLSGDDAEATSGECLMQNQFLKDTVKAEDMEEDAVQDGANDEIDAETKYDAAASEEVTDKGGAEAKGETIEEEMSQQETAEIEDEQESALRGESKEEATQHRESEQKEKQHETEDDVSEQQATKYQEPPKCATKADCKGDGQDCVGDICVIAASLTYTWTLATVDKKCPGKSIAALDKGKPEILTCKKKCETIPGCTGFNRGKKGNIESKCWFFSACTKSTPKGKLDISRMHNVYFVSANAEVEIATITKKKIKVLG